MGTLSEKSGKRLEKEEGGESTEEESDADMTRPKSEGRPNYCFPRCPDIHDSVAPPPVPPLSLSLT
ncbi:conserved hypothetical protein [Ricinus communis]|uniref:Uncharacterized protein n=1 Tax=Ricinus communis TaxID=3988 RepID=B9S8P0_RICCO|nr:conserved hypothetical protein [Ricinus communis]